MEPFSSIYQKDRRNRQKQPRTDVPGKSVLKICSKFTGERLCSAEISIKLQSNFIEIALRHGCFFSCKFAAYFRTPFPKNTSGRLLLNRRSKHRSSHLQMFFRKDIFKNFSNFTGKHLCFSLFLIKLRAKRFILFMWCIEWSIWKIDKNIIQHQAAPAQQTVTLSKSTIETGVEYTQSYPKNTYLLKVNDKKAVICVQSWQ